MRRRQCRCAAGRRRAGWGIGRGPAGPCDVADRCPLAQRGQVPLEHKQPELGLRSQRRLVPHQRARERRHRLLTSGTRKPIGSAAPPVGTVVSRERRPSGLRQWEWRHCTALHCTAGEERAWSTHVPSGTRGSSRCRSTHGCFGSAPTPPVRNLCCGLRCNHGGDSARAERNACAQLLLGLMRPQAPPKGPNGINATSRAELTLINLSTAVAPRGSDTIGEAFSAVEGIRFPTEYPWGTPSGSRNRYTHGARESAERL